MFNIRLPSLLTALQGDLITFFASTKDPMDATIFGEHTIEHFQDLVKCAPLEWKKGDSPKFIKLIQWRTPEEQAADLKDLLYAMPNTVFVIRNLPELRRPRPDHVELVTELFGDAMLQCQGKSSPSTVVLYSTHLRISVPGLLSQRTDVEMPLRECYVTMTRKEMLECANSPSTKGSVNYLAGTTVMPSFWTKAVREFVDNLDNLEYR